MSYRLPNADGVVFDFNGTLFWDESQNRMAWDETAKRIRGYELTDSEFSSLNGRTDDEMVLALIPCADDDTLIYWSNEKEAVYKDICMAIGPVLSPGALELFEELAARGMKMAIASSCPKCNMDWYYPYFHLDRYFAPECVIAGRRDIPSKPDGTIFRIAFESIGVKPENGIVFEDSLSGVKSAIDAGARYIYRVIGEGRPLGIEGIEEISSISEVLL